MAANRKAAEFPVHPEVAAAKAALFAAFNTGIDIGKAREALAHTLAQHHPREQRHPDQLEPTTLRNAFERRRLVRNRFLGPISATAWGKGYSNYCNLISDGWTVTILLNDKIQKDAIAADPDAGTVEFMGGVTLKGLVEIRMERGR